MFERYTERARRVLFFARYEASQLGSIAIETEHLLLGLIREGKGLTARIFARSHVSFETIRKEIEGRTVFREKISVSVEIPFSPEVKRALNFAAEESDRLLHNYIGTEHLLLGILREERSVAASILREKGLRLETVRDDIVQLLSDKKTTAPGEAIAEQDASGLPVHIRDGVSPVPALPQYIPSRVVHITYSHLSPVDEPWIQYAGNTWRAFGHTLAQIVAYAWQVHDRFVKLVDARIDDERIRYDFTIVRSHEIGPEMITGLLRDAIQEQLAVDVTVEDGDIPTVSVRSRQT